MEYLYLGLLGVVGIVGIIYAIRRGETGTPVISNGTVSELPIVFGDANSLSMYQGGVLRIHGTDLVVVDDSDVEQLRMPITNGLQIRLRNYNMPWATLFWDIVGSNGKTLRFKPKMPFSLFIGFKIANYHEHLISTLRQIAGEDVVRVDTMAQPSVTRAVQVMSFIVITALMVFLVFVVVIER